MTPRQKKILETIQASVTANGYPPSMREIGDTVGLASLSSVTHQLSQLEKMGYIRRDPKRPRAMEILVPLLIHKEKTDAADAPAGAGSPASVTELTTAVDTAMVPLVGRIAAGGPILADQVVEEMVPLPRQLVGHGELFMLRVSGDS
ncbi:MAG: transcriptional repressor LexA, partial [Arthrobacter sp.]